nr:hypothetical protein Iba_chr06dCG7190 [Ipomoea batatas]
MTQLLYCVNIMNECQSQADDVEGESLDGLDNLARLEAQDDSQDAMDEELEGVGLVKDSELLKSAKATYSKEVKALKADLTKIGANLATAQEGWKKALETLKSAQENAVKAFKELEEFHEDAMAHAGMHARTIVDQWFEGEAGKQYLLDLDTLGDILMDRAYLESTANVDSVAGMSQASVPTLTEVGQDDATVTEVEEDLSDALQLNRQRAKSSERHLPTRTSGCRCMRSPSVGSLRAFIHFTYRQSPCNSNRAFLNNE